MKMKVIFDLDGTLYRFQGAKDVGFTESKFYLDLKRRIITFLEYELSVVTNEAESILERISKEFEGEISLGLEEVYGIDRYTYYEKTWSCEPSKYITKDNQLAKELEFLKGNSLLLTAAPLVWTKKVLEYLRLADFFESNIITGEPDSRKPSVDAFSEAARTLNSNPTEVISVGDQNYSDIIPANKLGMKTVFIGQGENDADYSAHSILGALSLIRKDIL